MNSRNPFLDSLSESIIYEEALGLKEPERKKSVAQVAEFVRGQVQSLPLLPRVMFASGMLGFKILVLVRHFSRFQHLPVEKRSRIVKSWSWGRMALRRQLFRVLRSTAFLAFYEIPEVRAGLDATAPGGDPGEAGKE